MSFPMIGISGSIDREETRHFILRGYMRCIAEADGVPLLLSPDMTAPELAACVQQLDGLMLAGGNDIDPVNFHQTPIPELQEVNPLRDQLELALIRAFYQADKPVFGICRGLQMLNVALGGTVYQDLSAQYPHAAGQPPIAHQQTSPAQYPFHRVTVTEGSLLRQLMGQSELGVNSFHHQAVWAVAPKLTVCARADDGVIEAAEDASRAFVLGVQWHPERMTENDPLAKRLFQAFVHAAIAPPR